MRFEATIEKRGSGHLLEIPFDVKAKSQRTLIGSGPCRDRTYDLGIKSPLLYQLS